MRSPVAGTSMTTDLASLPPASHTAASSARAVTNLGRLAVGPNARRRRLRAMSVLTSSMVQPASRTMVTTSYEAHEVTSRRPRFVDCNRYSHLVPSGSRITSMAFLRSWCRLESREASGPSIASVFAFKQTQYLNRDHYLADGRDLAELRVLASRERHRSRMICANWAESAAPNSADWQCKVVTGTDFIDPRPKRGVVLRVLMIDDDQEYPGPLHHHPQGRWPRGDGVLGLH